MKGLPILLLMVLAACGEGEQMPEGILDRETFKNVLLESQLIDARMEAAMTVEQVRDAPADSLYEAVFRRYDTDRGTFRETFHHYSSRPEELRAIYEEVIAELGTRRDMVPQTREDTATADTSLLSR